MKTNRLRLVVAHEPTERVYGSPVFIARTRNVALASPVRFEPAKQVAKDDVWL